MITDVKAYHADKNDGHCLQDIVIRTNRRFRKEGLLWRNVLADTNYSNGENYQFLEELGLESFIPTTGGPIKEQCIGKAFHKRIKITHFRDEYERNNARLKTKKGRYMKAKRQGTVEPVLGNLKEYGGLGKINTIGIEQANKGMHLAAIAYNLKKYLKFIKPKVKTGANALLEGRHHSSQPKKAILELFSAVLTAFIFPEASGKQRMGRWQPPL